jgi:hypothetical protein
MALVATELTVTLQSSVPGALATALEAIARAGINVDALNVREGTMHLLTRDAPATQRALRAAGVRVRSERQVAVVEVDDRPGVVAGLIRRVAEAGLNVDFSYLAIGNRLVVGGDDPQRIAKLLA